MTGRPPHRRPAGGKPAVAHGVAQPAVVAGATAVILAVAYLVAPRMGGDLAAQIAHADFARSHPLTPIDFRWFGGISAFGYSLYVPWLAAALGTRLLGAVAAVIGSVLTATIFARTGVRRPVLGGALAAGCQISNLVEGRVAFGVGLAAALGAVLALTAVGKARRVGLVIGAGLAGAASPVAALLLGVVAAALLLHRRTADAVLLMLAAAVPVVVVSGVFGDGGAAVFNGMDALRAAAAGLVVAALTPRRLPMLRTGALVGTVMVVVAYAVPSPVGGNAARLTLLFAVPVVAAVADLRPRRTAVAVVLIAVVQTPVTFGTLAGAGAPATNGRYFTPLTQALLARGPLTGRVEIPELTGHWEAAYAARDVPLARGWLRQLDTALNHDVFYDHAPTPDTYRSFLQRSAVQYVAIPDARLTFYGRRESSLIAAGLPYLQPVWRNADWTLYAVADPVPVVSTPGSQVGLHPADIDLAAPARQTVTVHIRWSKWLDVKTNDPDACIAPSGNAVVLHTVQGGSYVIGSGLSGAEHHCQ